MSRPPWGKEYFDYSFKLTDLYELRYYFGVLIEQKGNKMLFHQSAYCERLIKRFGLDFAKSVPIGKLDNIDIFLRDAAPTDVGKIVVKASHTMS